MRYSGLLLQLFDAASKDVAPLPNSATRLSSIDTLSFESETRSYFEVQLRYGSTIMFYLQKW